MAILHDTVLLASGGYDIGDRVGGAPDWLLNIRKNSNCSLHHILPYRYPKFVGFLIETYRKTLVAAGDQARWPVGAQDERSRKVAELLAVVSPGGSQRDLPTQFAWIGPNLFEGPAGVLRIDDPGSSKEPNRPLSMSKDLWRQLGALGAQIDRLAVLSSAGGKSVVSRNITVGDFDDLLHRLSPILLRRQSSAAMFDESDWLCLSSTEPRFQLGPDDRVTGPVRDIFRVFATGNPAKLVIYKPDTKPAEKTFPIFWRLRLDLEAAPTAVFKAPKIQDTQP